MMVQRQPRLGCDAPSAERAHEPDGMITEVSERLIAPVVGSDVGGDSTDRSNPSPSANSLL